jgi:hypothetical protein
MSLLRCSTLFSLLSACAAITRLIHSYSSQFDAVIPQPRPRMSLLSSSRLLLACLLVFLLSLSPLSLGQSILQNYATTYPSWQSPSSLAVSSNALYIADTSNGRVVRMSLNGSVEFVYTSQTSMLWIPRGVAIDGSGNIYIATTLGSLVLEVYCLPSISIDLSLSLKVAVAFCFLSGFVRIH